LKKSRGRARELYRRIRRSGKAAREQLLDGARQYAREVIGKEPRFIKHPTTWLNGECWADEQTITTLLTIDGTGREVVDVASRPTRGLASAVHAIELRRRARR